MKKEMKMIMILLIGVILIIIILSNLVRSEMLISDSDVKFDSKITEEFNKNQTSLSVIVRLKDNSGINITGARDEKIQLIIQREEWFKPIIDEILTNLSEDEFKSVSKFSNGFNGKITKKGFDKLINNKKIGTIYLDTEVHITLDESETESDKSKEGLEKDKIFLICLIIFIIILIVIVKSHGSQTHGMFSLVFDRLRFPQSKPHVKDMWKSLDVKNPKSKTWGMNDERFI